MQKFSKGDHVRVVKDLGSSMSHFQSDCEAVVIGSYSDQFGGSDTKNYTIHIKGSGETSWYYEHQLDLIESNRIDILHEWEMDEKIEQEEKSNLDWIFSNGNGVLANPHGSTISALAKCFGMKDLWGCSGEGFAYYRNAMLTLGMAKPFLESGDKEGWLKFCDLIKLK